MSSIAWMASRLHYLSLDHLQLVYLLADIKLPIVFDEMGVLLCGSHRPPMRQRPSKSIRSNKLPAWAGVQLSLLVRSHSAPLDVIVPQSFSRGEPLLSIELGGRKPLSPTVLQKDYKPQGELLAIIAAASL